MGACDATYVRPSKRWSLSISVLYALREQVIFSKDVLYGDIIHDAKSNA